MLGNWNGHLFDLPTVSKRKVCPDNITLVNPLLTTSYVDKITAIRIYVLVCHWEITSSWLRILIYKIPWFLVLHLIREISHTELKTDFLTCFRMNAEKLKQLEAQVRIGGKVSLAVICDWNQFGKTRKVPYLKKVLEQKLVKTKRKSHTFKKSAARSQITVHC